MPKWLSISISLVGAVVLAGWILGVEAMTSILPGAVTMKVTTAICFVFVGLMLSVLCTRNRSTVRDSMIAASALHIMAVMGLMMIETLFGKSLGIDDLIVEESASAPYTTVPGRPSIATMVCFFVLAIYGGFRILAPDQWSGAVKATAGAFVTIMGSIALLGYATHIPELFFYFDGKSTSMAIHTAGLFVVAGLIVLAQPGSQNVLK